MPTENDRVSGRSDVKRAGGTNRVARPSKSEISLGVNQTTSRPRVVISPWNQRSRTVLPLPRGPVSTASRGAPLPASRYASRSSKRRRSTSRPAR